mgnify:CR=1 FL=1|jgi:succinate dehydrogenase hydrophobic anchor subunit
MPWIVDILAGLLLAVLLYSLVRFRMLAAPVMRDRFGSWARWGIWVLVALLMIAVANLELIGLRQVLQDWFGEESLLAHEMLFALVALALGYFLVARYVIRKPRDKNSGKGC